MRNRSCVVAAALLVLGAPAAAQSIDRGVAELLAQVRREAAAGDRYWPGFARAPFGFVLVEEGREVLLCDDRVPDGFVRGARDPQTGCASAIGPRSWRQPGLLAAMPVFGPPSVVVMGAPAASGRIPGAWKSTVLHEHFHQWQADLPRYYARVAALDLAGGDESGMWMLQYPFPYAREDVGAAWRTAAHALHRALVADDAELKARTAEYLAARRALATSVDPRDWRYYDFQLWQEGVARWTEIAVGEAAGGDTALAAQALRTATLEQLASVTLAESGRESVYPLGAAEAMLLERVDPDWRGCYRVVLTLGECWEGLAL